MSQATDSIERDLVPTQGNQARERYFRTKALAGDKHYDGETCAADLPACSVTPHGAQHQRTAERDRTRAPDWSALAGRAGRQRVTGSTLSPKP